MHRQVYLGRSMIGAALALGLAAVAGGAAVMPAGAPQPRQAKSRTPAPTYIPKTPRTRNDLERIAEAEAKRARKAAKLRRDAARSGWA